MYFPTSKDMHSGTMASGGICVTKQCTESHGNIFEKLGVIAEKPKYPQYATMERRIQSFKKWPKNKNPKPKDLAEAGFAYTGVEDAVRCFHCGNGLKDWEQADCPWRQHAFHFRNCAHVRLCKGEEYIRGIHGETSVEVDGDCDDNGDIPRLSKRRIMEENISAILTAKEYNIEDTKIKKAVQHFLTSGKEKFSAVDLMEMVEELEIDSNKTETDSTSRKICTTAEHDNETADSNVDKTKSHAVCNKNRNKTQNNAQNRKDTQNCNKDQTEKQQDYHELKEENESLKETLRCKICFDANACIITVPCGHMVTCPQCVGPLQKCCLCRAPIHGTIRAFLAD